MPTRTKYGTNGAAPSSRPPITDYMIKSNGQGTMSMAKVLVCVENNMMEARKYEAVCIGQQDDQEI